MCDFISWIEKNGNVYFLTYHDIYRTKRGKELRDYCKDSSDYIGHGAIRYFYDNFTGGIEKECTDFSSPENFPAEIVESIKSEKFVGLGIDRELLSNAAWAEYDKVNNAAWAEYNKVRNAARAEYDKVRNAAWAECEKVHVAAWAEYEKVRDAARAEYEKVHVATFWNLFAKKKNRNPAWY